MPCAQHGPSRRGYGPALEAQAWTSGSCCTLVTPASLFPPTQMSGVKVKDEEDMILDSLSPQRMLEQCSGGEKGF